MRSKRAASGNAGGDTEEVFDVGVVGGGSAGVAAAIGAAACGARVVLLERYGFLGGAATARGVVTYCGLYTLGQEPRQVVRGVAERVLQRLKARDAVTPPQRHRGVFVVFDPETLKLVLDELCDEAGVTVLLHSLVTSASMRSGLVSTVTFNDHGGAHRVSAKSWVDASGDCDLAAFAEASIRYGNHGLVNLGTLPTRFGGIPPDVEIDHALLRQRVDEARGKGRFVTKSDSVIVRLPISGDVCCYLASADCDPRDALSMSAAEAAGRRQAYTYLNIIRTLPGCERAYLVCTGSEFGTRESRHINSLDQLTWKQVLQGAPRSDSVALGAWGAEWHDRRNYSSRFELPPAGGSYQIPLGCLRSNLPNLFAAGRTADGDREAGSSLRVMGTAFATGQAAGVAAAEYAVHQAVDVENVQAHLTVQQAMW